MCLVEYLPYWFGLGEFLLSVVSLNQLGMSMVVVRRGIYQSLQYDFRSRVILILEFDLTYVEQRIRKRLGLFAQSLY